MSSPVKRIAILGTRGVPARHGGFETFAEMFARYLVDRGWRVRVYCQLNGSGAMTHADWHGVEQIRIPVSNEGPWGTIVFDWLCMRHACAADYPLLILGYNTAVFSVLARVYRRPNAMNMDGIEWLRQKWSLPVRAWFYLNEIAGCVLANRLVADHPSIAEHLGRWVNADKIDTIPYGALPYSAPDTDILARLKLEAGCYILVIARPEPENSIVEIVRAFSRIKTSLKLVVLGDFRPGQNTYHARVLDAGSDSVCFPGAIYDGDDVGTLRKRARFYIHGHQVGGTNPSLIEALANGSPVLAHDNRFNRWVAGEGAAYFRDEKTCESQLRELLVDDQRCEKMAVASRQRHAEAFTWKHVLPAYEDLCARLQMADARA